MVKATWCPFQYECLPNFYYSCGKLEHLEKECDDCVGKGGEKQYGDGLRAAPARWKGMGEAKSQWTDMTNPSGNKEGRNGGSGRGPNWNREEQVCVQGTKIKCREDMEMKDDVLSLMRKNGVGSASHNIQSKRLQYTVP